MGAMRACLGHRLPLPPRSGGCPRGARDHLEPDSVLHLHRQRLTVCSLERCLVKLLPESAAPRWVLFRFRKHFAGIFIMLSSHLAQRVGLLAALLLPASFANSSRALPPLGGNGQHAGKGIAKELHAAKELLEQADHDYDGYRAKAVHHITEALHDLHGHHQNGAAKSGQKPPHTPKNNNGAGGNGAGHKPHEPQANSDAQLQKAAQILAAAEGQLGSQHPKAHAEVQAAINDIAIALKKK
jgi:hypothetical protein